ncbi:MAG: type II toxin-antitoxin system death-on-curing family toxin [Rhodobacteraceae bacterium]|jgi:death-on-curing protein|nr:type II toxin-antitoxin system death-on-curing family toxin [Paracoccaceae bacterium]
MTFVVLTSDIVDQLHDAVLNPGELPGRAMNKSLDGALARVDNRLAYGLIEDLFDLAAAYAIAISQGHCYNDGNERTGFRAMDAVLVLNGVTLPFDTVAVGQIIIRAAQRKLDEAELGLWLRQRAP